MIKPTLIVFLEAGDDHARDGAAPRQRASKIVEFTYDSKVVIIEPLIEEQNHSKANLDSVRPLIHEAGDDHARYSAAPRQPASKILEFTYDSKVAIIAPPIEEQNHDKANLDRVPSLIHEAGDDHARDGAAPRQPAWKNSGISI